MSAMADLLALAIVGYLFLYAFKYTRVGISQKSGYQVLFLSSIVGVLIVIFSQTVGKHIIAKWDIKLCLGVIRLDDMAIATALATTFSVIAWAVDSALNKLNKRDLSFRIFKWQGKDNLIKITLYEVWSEIETVEIYTRMNSKYVGIVKSVPPMNSSLSGDVALLAVFETRVDASTGKETTIDYFSPVFNEKKKKIQKENSVQNKEGLEKQATKEALRELPQIIVPLTEIVAIKKEMP